MSPIARNFSVAFTPSAANENSVPPLAPGAPTSPERMALIEAFKKQSEGLQKKFEPRTHKSDWAMPYRLFQPEASGKLPLVLYLHGSGGSSWALETFSARAYGCCPKIRNIFLAMSSYPKPIAAGFATIFRKRATARRKYFPAWGTARAWHSKLSKHCNAS